jgi:hypothetical protein
MLAKPAHTHTELCITTAGNQSPALRLLRPACTTSSFTSSSQSHKWFVDPNPLHIIWHAASACNVCHAQPGINELLCPAALAVEALANKKKEQNVESEGIDPPTSRMLSGRSTI